MQCIMGYVPMIHKITFVATKGQALIRNTERAPLLVPSLSVQNKSYEPPYITRPMHEAVPNAVRAAVRMDITT